jgi:hypothetical protein
VGVRLEVGDGFVDLFGDRPGQVLSVVDLADDGVIGVGEDAGMRGPRPLGAGGAVVVSVTGCSAW